MGYDEKKEGPRPTDKALRWSESLVSAPSKGIEHVPSTGNGACGKGRGMTKASHSKGASQVTAVLSIAPLRTDISCFVPFVFLSLPLQELQKYEQFIFADHTNMIHVENVYEEILHQILLDETLKGKEGFPGAGESSR